ncbi:MAG: zf-TFIIB domain-containing protein [Planctomycetaceae bacterium]|nr:zf-TFIIB domain-containing protein [Planctomycetaceae bacterium]
MSGNQKVVEACGACGRQYDVTHLPRGGRVRCACGSTLEVRHVEPHAPRTLRCSNCGGNLVDGARKCEYCAAQISLREQRLDAVCPACFARCSSGARHCMECGVRIEPQALFALAEGQTCPRCAGELRDRVVGNTHVIECAACGGLWLGTAQFEQLCRRTEAESVAPGTFASGLARVETYERQKYIPCLACKSLMLRRNYAGSSGVVIDACRQHGVWLDSDELERILAFVRGGGLDRARARQVEQLNAAKRLATPPLTGDVPRADARWELGAHIGLSVLLDLFGD